MIIKPEFADKLPEAIMQYDAACILAGLMPLDAEAHDMLNGINNDPELDPTERTAWLDDQRARICHTRDQCDTLDILAEALARENLL